LPIAFVVVDFTVIYLFIYLLFNFKLNYFCTNTL